ncbi:MAG: hypothetical protein EXS14_00350 [Planctomycetes bacterium]|nr:hypothetical protein [Planctomycetota bacterium]
MKALLLLVVAFLLQAWLRPDTQEGVAVARSTRTTASSLVFSGARPLLARWLWFDFEASLGKGALPQALDDLRLLLLVGSEDPRAALHLARFLAFDVAPREGVAPERMQRVFEAESIIARARTQFPLDPHLPLLHAQILSMPWTAEPQLHAVWSRRHGCTPARQAAREFAEVLRLAPGSPHSALLAGDAARVAGIESVLTGASGGWDEILASAAMIKRGHSAAGETLLQLTSAWQGAARAMQEGDAAAAAVALASAVQCELPGEEAGFIRAMVPEFCEKLTPQDAASAARALSAVEALHSIINHTAAVGMDQRAPAALQRLVQHIVAADRDMRERLPKPLRPEK